LRASARLQHLKEQALVERKLQKVDALKPIAEELGVSLAQLAIGWAASNRNVSTVITGATKPSQVRCDVVAAAVSCTY
jgi:aryl-alcohol dehydrogenase-like predicted oxidoreductase